MRERIGIFWRLILLFAILLTVLVELGDHFGIKHMSILSLPTLAIWWDISAAIVIASLIMARQKFVRFTLFLTLVVWAVAGPIISIGYLITVTIGSIIIYSIFLLLRLMLTYVLRLYKWIALPIIEPIRVILENRKEIAKERKYVKEYELMKRREEKKRKRTLAFFVTISLLDVCEKREGHSGRWIHGTYARLWPNGKIEHISPFAFETSNWKGKVSEWRGPVAELLQKAVRQGKIGNDACMWDLCWFPGHRTTTTLYFNADGEVLWVV